MHDQPPVAELVAEPLDDHRAVVRDVAGGLPLLVEVGDEVGGGPGVQARRGDAFLCLLLWKARQLAGERAERAAQLGGTAEGVAVPERQLAGLAGGGRDEHPVGGDVLDAPRAGAEDEHVAHPRLVDHLLVELAHARGLLPDEEDAEEAPVGDRPAAGHGEPLRARRSRRTPVTRSQTRRGRSSPNSSLG